MTKEFEVRGVPRSILVDGWWLDAIDEAAKTSGGRAKGNGWPALSGTARRQGIGVLCLIVLGDILFWQQEIGISLAIFALAVVLVASADLAIPARVRGGVICLIGALPVVDHVQPLSLAFLAFGVTAAIFVQRASSLEFHRLAANSFGFLLSLPRQWFKSFSPVRQLLAQAPAARPGASSKRLRGLKDWAFPLGGSLVFLALLMDANPLFLSFGTDLVAPWDLLRRALFWGGIALFILPFLQTALPDAPMPNTARLRLPGLGLNAASALRALIMFNLLIGAQMLSDLAVLIGGAELPRHMTYAEYAHRGAYPLLATAMLAMGFALVSRPYWDAHRLIRPLMLLWLAQNILLTGSAALRLDLYIEVYGQTYLRLYALIWMGLVAFGLILAVFQLLLSRDTFWLVVRAATGAAITLYACAFVNFASIIAAHNLSHPNQDLAYVCDLGPMAAGSFAEAAAKDTGLVEAAHMATYYCHALTPPEIQGWRDWGYRGWQVNRMVAAANLPEPFR